MATSFKNIWWIFILIGAGGIILILSFYPNKVSNDQGVVLNDLFHQQAPQAEPKNVSSVVQKTDFPPSKGIATSPPDDHESGFAIQVYSFQDKNRAQMALQALKSSGYRAFLFTSDLGDKGIWYRVRIGGIADEAAAHAMLEEIRKAYSSGFIIKPQNESL